MDIMTTFVSGSSVDAAYPAFLRVRVPATTLLRTGGEVRLENGAATQHAPVKPLSGTRRPRSSTV